MVIATVGKYKVVDLFPYKIKDISNFLVGKHPDFHPTIEANKYKQYWKGQWTKVVEGQWVDDNGTWVYMMPKLYFYGNYATIELQGRYTGHRPKGRPYVRDNEWIMFTYLLCCQGFSGFMEDDFYTCNTIVKKIQEGKDLTQYDYEELTENCYVPGTKTLKKYVGAWEYLTQTYLIDDKRNYPLGRPIYENQASNFCLLGCRTIGKTLSLGPGDCLHEFLTNGLKYVEDLPEINNTKVEIFVGAADSNYLENFLSKTGESYRNLPGAYDLGSYIKPSPFWRATEGVFSIKSRSPITQQRPQKDNSKAGSGSRISKGIFTKQNPQASVGQRPVRIYVDEFGLQENAKDVHGSNDAALKADGWKHGIAVYTGTSGNLEKIVEAQDIFQNPETYDIYPIPNYWEDDSKMQGLFIPQMYALKKFKDKNGNTDHLAALKQILKERKEKKLEEDGLSMKILNEPVIPSEMFISRGNNIFPQARIIRRIEKLKAGLWESKAKVGKLVYVGKQKVNVRFIPDHTLKAITEYKTPKSAKEKAGAFVIYEPPRIYGEDGGLNKHIYKVAYDPVADPEDGTSLASVIVYKGVPPNMQGEMFDTIVAEWIGRVPRLEDIHDIAIMAAMHYNCKLLYEANTSGLGVYFRSQNKLSLLQKVPFAAIEEVVAKPSKKIKLGGVKVGTQVKKSYIGDSNDWAREVYTVSDEDEEFTNVDRLYSLRLLNEWNFFGEGNYDHMSSWILIMMLIKEDLLVPTLQQEEESKSDDYDEIMHHVNNRIYG